MIVHASLVADQQARERALDLRHSFIVRAPAGAGKTRLLIQRYLALLAGVDEPEEITAITFTRKAAAEMRARVLRAFASAAQAGSVSSDVETGDDDAVTRQLARAALACDAERGWQLAANPSRLRIQTIDSMNATLTRQMPITARFGAQPESIDDAGAMYQEAARNLLAAVHDSAGSGVATDNPVAEDIAVLLAHLDNHLAVAENLLADMLRSRDQWLRNLPAMHERDALEGALSRVREAAAAGIAALFPAAECEETLALARFSGQNRSESLASTGVWVDGLFANDAAFPSADANTLPQWLALADLLLTQSGAWRKRGGLNKNVGFPTSAEASEKARLAAWKNRMGDLLERFAEAGEENDALRVALSQLRELPPGGYTESQWAVLGAIVRLLPFATAELWGVFGAKGQCDFTEISQAASRALGDDDAPTDLALALDYRIRHLLVDEFQDTSIAQFELLEKLTRGWSEGDGRTLLAVGDPMQSIYRFREAEVGLFLNAARTGIGSVPLLPLTLQVNFRSQPGIVDWVNETFGGIMPSTGEAGPGEIPYAANVASARNHGGERASEDGRRDPPCVHWHPQCLSKRSDSLDEKVVDADDTVMLSASEIEAGRVVEIIGARRRENPAAEIAILVRNRGHLRDIVPALKAANIDFRAVDIDPLNERPVVLDLLSLTRALTHPADRIAWLAVLRAPWCGLTLNDLAVLTGSAVPVNGELTSDPRTVWEMLEDEARVDELSSDGRGRVQRIRSVLANALGLCRRMPLRDLVERTWFALQGPACLPDPSDLTSAAQWLDLLEDEALAQTGGGDIEDFAAFERRVDKLYAGGGTAHEAAPPAVQIMTIHKAKGLEFDTVIVPGLQRTPRMDAQKLLAWTEQLNPNGDSELLLAPIGETGAIDDGDAIYRFVRRRDREKQQAEDVRLIYVAATRAEQQLHLLATVIVDEDDGGEVSVSPPRSMSLLAAMWPAVSHVFHAAANDVCTATPERARSSRAKLTSQGGVAMHLSLDSPAPSLPAAITCGHEGATDQAAMLAGEIDFEWVGNSARHVGSVVHGVLQTMAEDGLENWNDQRINASRTFFERDLARLGVTERDLSPSVDRVVRALINTLADTRGRWILQSRAGARSEWRLTGIVDDRIAHVAIDRTFIDEAGVRWIVDFKTGGHEGADIDAFLDNEQSRYRQQLETYAALVNAMQAGQSRAAAFPTIKLGLFFPLLAGWREWEWRADAPTRESNPTSASAPSPIP